MPGAILVVRAMLLACASGQEFTQVQSLTSRVLLAKEDLTAEQRAIEQRRVEELDKRTQQQAILLAEQTRAVRSLTGQLQLLQDERRLIDLVNAFDAAMAAGNQRLAREFVNDSVTLDVIGRSGEIPETLSGDVFVARISTSMTKGKTLPRSNQRVRIDGDHATLTADDASRNKSTTSIVSSSDRSGTYLYSLLKTPAGWKINGLAFNESRN